MAIQFPDNPVVGQTYKASNNVTYEYEARIDPESGKTINIWVSIAYTTP